MNGLAFRGRGILRNLSKDGRLRGERYLPESLGRGLAARAAGSRRILHIEARRGGGPWKGGE